MNDINNDIPKLGRMSARYIGNEVGKSAKWVYEILKDMGLVIKDNLGNWVLTEAGKKMNGKMSYKSGYPVPTFVFEEIVPKMIEFYKKHRM